MDASRFLVRPGQRVRLADLNPSDTAGSDKAAGAVRMAELTARLEHLQELLWADRRHAVLVVLQAMDTGGKDGTIRHVFEGVNPLGVKVASFKAPTEDERGHDYLWRVHRHAPGKGELVIFNRSHYEDVLVVRVHNLVPKEVWSRRYRHINEWERLLADEGATILKFFLHISKDEQRKRLQSRVDDPEKRWKFARGDLAERQRWGDYQTAYEAVLNETSTDHAPWYAIPSNKKWFRNLAVSEVLVDALERLDLRYPEPEDDVTGLVVN